MPVTQEVKATKLREAARLRVVASVEEGRLLTYDEIGERVGLAKRTFARARMKPEWAEALAEVSPPEGCSETLSLAWERCRQLMLSKDDRVALQAVKLALELQLGYRHKIETSGSATIYKVDVAQLTPEQIRAVASGAAEGLGIGPGQAALPAAAVTVERGHGYADD